MLLFPLHSARTAALAALARLLDARMEDDDDEDDEDDPNGGKHRGRRSDSELAEQVRRLVEKRGGGEAGSQAVALMLLTENEKVRDGRRRWRERAEKAEKVAPKDGEIVIKKADAEAFEKYKAFGTPDEVKTKVEKSTALEVEKTQREAGEKVAEAAKLAGLTNGSLLAKLARADRENFIVDIRDETKDGKTVKVPFARENKEGSAFKPLSEFAKSELKEYYPALIAKGDPSGSSTAGERQSAFTPFTEQSPAGTAAVGDRAEQFIKQRNENAAARPNPLKPAGTKT